MACMDYKIIRSSRRTVALQIKAGCVVVRCPYGTKAEWIDRFVASKRDWIEEKLRKHPVVEPMGAEALERLKRSARALLPDRVKTLADLMGVSYGRITIRAQRSRWGSCSSAGNLNFNCLLMVVPEQVRDYVIVHELCHRLYMNHSALFWKTVEKYVPDYRQKRAWLKANGDALIGSLPE